MSVFSAQFIAESLGFETMTETKFNRIITDSRVAKPGDFFVPIKGDRFDGHNYIEKAVAAGATGFLTERPIKASVLSIEVPSALEAYRSIAKAWRLKHKIPIAAVVGSVGKTTTKEFLAAMLSGRFKKVLKTQASQNGFVGIPMTLLELRPEHDAAVVEVGIDEIGAMEKHLEIVRPDFTVLTAIAEEHLEKLKDLQTVAKEELLALTWTEKNGGKTAYNLEDPNIKNAGLTSGRGYTLKDLQKNEKIPLPGNHNALNYLGAKMLALSMGLSESEIRNGLNNFSAPKGRSHLFKLSNGASILGDYYNANPASVKAALELFDTISAPQKIVCLGDMLELGPDELKYHESLAPLLKSRDLKAVYLYGPRMESLEKALKDAPFEVAHFDSHEKIAQKLELSSDSALLIKGSRGMTLEKVLEAYLKISGAKPE